MPFFLQKSWNSELVKAVPLSLTIISGIPCVANALLNLDMVLAELAEGLAADASHELADQPPIGETVIAMRGARRMSGPRLGERLGPRVADGVASEPQHPQLAWLAAGMRLIRSR